MNAMNKDTLNQESQFNIEKSSTYDELIKKVIPGHDTLHELAKFLLEDLLKDTSKILVAGCGTGQEIINLSKNNPNWKFVGFDPSEKMLSMAIDSLKANNCEKRVHLIEGFINDVKEINFDAATAILVLQFLPSNEDIQKFLDGISSKLKPGSPIILVYLEGSFETRDYSVLNSAWKYQQYRTRNDSQAVNDEFNQREKGTTLVSQEQIEACLETAGFSAPLRFFQAYLLTGQIAFKI
jgi:tRNA (cmo5U34)-methyltransferase